MFCQPQFFEDAAFSLGVGLLCTLYDQCMILLESVESTSSRLDIVTMDDHVSPVYVSVGSAMLFKSRRSCLEVD